MFESHRRSEVMCRFDSVERGGPVEHARLNGDALSPQAISNKEIQCYFCYIKISVNCVPLFVVSDGPVDDEALR